MATLDFADAFRYPFRCWQGLLNILWILVPIYGWFLLIGYRVRIVGEFLQGKYTKLPRIAHGDDFVLGWKMFWKAVPAVLVLMAAAFLFGAFEGRRGGGPLVFLFVILALLVVPILAMNFMRKRTVASCFEFDLVRVVVKNFLDYVIAMLKDLALGLIFMVMILILVGIPASVFTKGMFTAEFYRGHVKK
jgi:hypothetical protein